MQRLSACWAGLCLLPLALAGGFLDGGSSGSKNKCTLEVKSSGDVSAPSCEAPRASAVLTCSDPIPEDVTASFWFSGGALLDHKDKICFADKVAFQPEGGCHWDDSHGIVPDIPGGPVKASCEADLPDQLRLAHGSYKIWVETSGSVRGGCTPTSTECPFEVDVLCLLLHGHHEPKPTRAPQPTHPHKTTPAATTTAASKTTPLATTPAATTTAAATTTVAATTTPAPTTTTPAPTTTTAAPTTTAAETTTAAPSTTAAETTTAAPTTTAAETTTAAPTTAAETTTAAPTTTAAETTTPAPTTTTTAPTTTAAETTTAAPTTTAAATTTAAPTTTTPALTTTTAPTTTTPAPTTTIPSSTCNRSTGAGGCLPESIFYFQDVGGRCTDPDQCVQSELGPFCGYDSSQVKCDRGACACK